ncbi:MAG TPA: PIN domain-containing protein [Verrucomicrobiae bacterium]|nr:PIN domain-containing protein [Verrucomicrobiae bacterium]
MRKAVLADTGPLYAAVDPHDANHSRSMRELQKLAGEKREVLVPFPTLCEAYSLVLCRLGGSLAAKWLAELSGATVVNPTLDDHREAVARLSSFVDQRITLFDTTLAAVALRLGVVVWTYDHHFDVMRVPVWR